ncbi:MAG TPA: hypothetical protein VL857_08175, partial [Candidatus Eisenbacteria bacterium]|nr:hypothetical protein [Candidatus Eisenbacteria bacterium]
DTQSVSGVVPIQSVPGDESNWPTVRDGMEWSTDEGLRGSSEHPRANKEATAIQILARNMGEAYHVTTVIAMYSSCDK